jgi:hypothetical protein
MSSEKSVSDNEISRVFGIAIIIFLVLAILPTVGFLQYGELLFGEHAIAKLFLLSSIGGALSSSICAEGSKQRLIAILPGILMGIGVPIAFILYVWLLQRESLMKIELVLLVLLGAFPGALLRSAMIQKTPSEG